MNQENNHENLGYEVVLEASFDDALEQVTSALKKEGFGVLTKIDVKAILKEKLGEDFRSFAILGVCNPSLAHRALSANSVVGLMLPCNVTVEANPAGGCLVMIANPEAMLSMGTLADNKNLAEVALEARQRLERVASSLK